MPSLAKEGISRPRLRSMLKGKADFEKNPRLATLLALWEMRQEIERVIEDLEKRLGDRAKEVVEAAFGDLQKDLEGKMENIVAEMPGFRDAVAVEFARLAREKLDSLPHLKGDPGKNGDNGKDANEERIVTRLGRKMRAELAAAIKALPKAEDGKDGSPDTPEDIRKKARKIEGAWLPKSAIQGLEEWMRNLERIARSDKKGGGGGGGGMGQVQHETFNLTSATTSVTTAYPISQGRAIWAQYQNGGLTYGVGFTVGANKRAINLLFTPVNGTFLDVTYIRG